MVPAAPPSPRKRGDNKAPRGRFLISYSTSSTGCSAPACGGSPAKRARGRCFPSPARAVVWFHHMRAPLTFWAPHLLPRARCARPPLVPVGTTFLHGKASHTILRSLSLPYESCSLATPQAGAQQGSVRHFFHKLLHSKHGLFCHRLRGGKGTGFVGERSDPKIQ